MDPRLLEQSPIVVIGMHRSGTRLVVELLAKLGVFMGADTQGDSESVAFMLINEGILQPGTIARDYWSVGGVKKPGSAGAVTVPTREYINGQWVTQNASFGRFGSMQEGMDALAEFVRDSPRFGPVVQRAAQTGDYAGMIEGMRQQGYATDPAWTQKVTSIASGLPVPAAAARTQPAAPDAGNSAPESIHIGTRNTFMIAWNP